MGGKAGGILPLIGIAAAVAATAFSGGAAAPALAGATAGGGVGGGAALGAGALTAAEMGAGAMTAAEMGAGAMTAAEMGAGAMTAAEAGSATLTAAELGAETVALGDAALAGGEAVATGAELTGGAEALATGAETVTAANTSTAAAQMNSLDAFVGEHGLAFDSAGKLQLAAPANATPVPSGAFDAVKGATDSGIWSWVKTNKDMIGLGTSAMGAVSSGVQGYQSAQAREGQLKLQAAQDALDMEEKARDAQLRLSHTLAAQNTFFQARGIPTGSGSALSAANSAESAADRAMTSITAMQQLGNAAARYGSAASGRAKTGAAVGSLLDFGGALADTYDLMPGRRTRRSFLL